MPAGRCVHAHMGCVCERNSLWPISKKVSRICGLDGGLMKAHLMLASHDPVWTLTCELVWQLIVVAAEECKHRSLKPYAAAFVQRCNVLGLGMMAFALPAEAYRHSSSKFMRQGLTKCTMSLVSAGWQGPKSPSLPEQVGYPSRGGGLH